MAEDETGEHPSPQPGIDPDPAALHAALNAVPEADAREYLRKQGALADKQVVLVDLQIEDLKREDMLRHWSPVVHHISARARAHLVGNFQGVIVGQSQGSAANEAAKISDGFFLGAAHGGRVLGRTGERVDIAGFCRAGAR